MITDLETDKEDVDDDLTFDQQVLEALSQFPQFEGDAVNLICEPTESDELKTW